MAKCPGALFYPLFDTVAEESTRVARRLLDNPGEVMESEAKWGIRVVAWVPGDVAYVGRKVRRRPVSKLASE